MNELKYKAFKDEEANSKLSEDLILILQKINDNPLIEVVESSVDKNNRCCLVIEFDVKEAAL